MQRTVSHSNSLKIVIVSPACLFVSLIPNLMFQKCSMWSIGICLGMRTALVQSAYLYIIGQLNEYGKWSKFSFRYLLRPIFSFHRLSLAWPLCSAQSKRSVQYLFGSPLVVAIIFAVYWCCK